MENSSRKPTQLTLSILTPAILVIVGVALLLRSWGLEIKPPHFDEGINGNFVAGMWRDGFYRYDPTNFHGPLYFYVLQIAEAIFGRGVFGFRFVTGLISTAIVIAIAMHRRFFGKSAIWAAAIVALSPAFVFYSRYAIHESLFILLQVMFSYGYFLWREERSRTSFALMATGVFGTFAVKETFFILFGTWVIAIVCVSLADRFFPIRASEPETPKAPPARAPASKSDLVAITVIGALITCALFTGFFMNQKGLVDMFAAYSFWTKTGVDGTGHEKPFFYWIKILWRYEWPCLIALVLSPVVFFFVSRKERLVVMVAFGTWLAYSLIPYKTPWLVLNMGWLLAFVLGFAVVRVQELLKFGRTASLVRIAKPGLAILAVAAIAGSSGKMLRLNFKDYTDSSEPYVYVQSTMQFKHVMDWIQDRVKLFPEDLDMKIMVLNKDPWPIPWTLGDFPQLNYGKAESADLANADVVLIDASSREALESRLIGHYWVLPFQVRDSYEGGFAYMSFDLFQGIVPSSGEIFQKATQGGTP